MLELPERPSLVEVRLVDGILDRPIRLSRLKTSWLSRQQKATALQRVQAAEARLAAEKLDLALALAEDSRGDSPDGEVGEFFVEELALVLNCSRAAATSLYGQAATLAGRLPATFAPLRAGALDWPRARAIAEELNPGWFNHVLKTHAPGWRFVLDDDGTLHVTTPSRITRTTRPPGLTEHPDPAGAEPADDPPPF